MLLLDPKVGFGIESAAGRRREEKVYRSPSETYNFFRLSVVALSRSSSLSPWKSYHRVTCSHACSRVHVHVLSLSLSFTQGGGLFDTGEFDVHTCRPHHS